MDITHLQEFIIISEEESFLKASAKLGISASALTRHLQSLEAEAGVILMTRNSHRVTLTNEGSLFLEYARSIVTSQTAMISELHIQSSSSNRLSIGVPMEQRDSDFEDFIYEFYCMNPDIRFDLSAYPVRKLFQNLLQKNIDFVFSHEFDAKDDLLIYTPMFKDELFVHIPEINPLYNAPVIDYSMLRNQHVYMRYNIHSQFARYIREIFSDLHIEAFFHDLQGFCPQYAPDSIYLTTGLKISSIRHPGNVRIVPLSPSVTFTYGLFRLSTTELTDEGKAFITYCNNKRHLDN